MGNAGIVSSEIYQDGAYAEFVPEPPVWVMLNLFGTLFRDLEALWWVQRRGTSGRPRPRRCLRGRGCGEPWYHHRGAGRLRMDEASNSVVHDDCWETHLKKTM